MFEILAEQGELSCEGFKDLLYILEAKQYENLKGVLVV